MFKKIKEIVSNTTNSLSLSKDSKDNDSKSFSETELSLPNIELDETLDLETKIKIFKFNAWKMLETHLKKFSNYKVQLNLMKEIKYLVKHSFNVYQDDFCFGNKIFKKNPTKIDDYIFSKYESDPQLSANIKKLAHVAYSGRFSKDPKENLRFYFLLIEESNFEIMRMFRDFYSILDGRKNISIQDYTIKAKYEIKNLQIQTLLETGTVTTNMLNGFASGGQLNTVVDFSDKKRTFVGENVTMNTEDED